MVKQFFSNTSAISYDNAKLNLLTNFVIVHVNGVFKSTFTVNLYSKATTIFSSWGGGGGGGGGGIFIVLVKKISEPSSVKICSSPKKESKNCFPIMWNRNTCFHKNNIDYSNSAAQYFFSSR